MGFGLMYERSAVFFRTARKQEMNKILSVSSIFMEPKSITITNLNTK